MGTSLPHFERSNLREPALPGPSIPAAHRRIATQNASETRAFDSEGVGRRIYVNEESFVSLAQASEEAARATYRLMGQASVESLVSHEVASHGVVLDGLEERQACEIQDQLRGSWKQGPSELLRHMGYRPQGKGEGWGPLESLLQIDECIAASCHFSSYYTFATSKGAAQRMFGDLQTIHEVKKQKKAKSAYEDLTLVSGPRLVLLAGLAPPRGAQVDGTPLGPAKVFDLKRAVYDETRRIYTRFLASLRSMLSETLLESLTAIPERVFSRGVLRLTEGSGDGPTCPC